MAHRLLNSSIDALLVLLAEPQRPVGQVNPTPTTQPRDVRPPSQNGTAVVRGRIVAGDTRRPLRRAQITVSSPDWVVTLVAAAQARMVDLR
jgi:hypothetical protein